MRPRLALLTALLALPLAACSVDDGSESTGESETSAGQTPSMADVFVDRCAPNESSTCEGFTEPHLCCSDDPTALDLANIEALVTPIYVGRGGEGVAVFSGANNANSTQGVCVASGSVPPVQALADVGAQGCPVPCNPLWDASDVTSVCGSGAQCCQVQELQQEDCVFDPNLSEAGCFRPATGFDIPLGYTTWAPSQHVTHQDPGGLNCEQFVAGLPTQELTDAGLTVTDVLNACYLRLGVASQRGLCLSGLDACPYAAPDYIDACEELNMLNNLPGC